MEDYSSKMGMVSREQHRPPVEKRLDFLHLDAATLEKSAKVSVAGIQVVMSTNRKHCSQKNYILFYAHLDGHEEIRLEDIGRLCLTRRIIRQAAGRGVV
jgi:hypothetical protein